MTASTHPQNSGENPLAARLQYKPEKGANQPIYPGLDHDARKRALTGNGAARCASRSSGESERPHTCLDAEPDGHEKQGREKRVRVRSFLLDLLPQRIEVEPRQSRNSFRHVTRVDEHHGTVSGAFNVVSAVAIIRFLTSTSSGSFVALATASNCSAEAIKRGWPAFSVASGSTELSGNVTSTSGALALAVDKIKRRQQNRTTGMYFFIL